MNKYLVKIGVVVLTKNGEQGKMLKFSQYGKDKVEALFNVFKEFNLLDVIKLDIKDAINYRLVNQEITKVEDL